MSGLQANQKMVQHPELFQLPTMSETNVMQLRVRGQGM